jgi:hypothetical protein
LDKRLGWRSITDLGDVSMTHGTEKYLALWMRAGDTQHAEVQRPHRALTANHDEKAGRAGRGQTLRQ